MRRRVGTTPQRVARLTLGLRHWEMLVRLVDLMDAPSASEVVRRLIEAAYKRWAEKTQ